MSTIKLNKKTLKNVVRRVIEETRDKKTTITEKALIREHKVLVNKTFQGISKKYKVINEDFRLRSFNRNYNLVQTKNVIRLLIKMDFLIKNYNQKILINYFHITTLRIING